MSTPHADVELLAFIDGIYLIDDGQNKTLDITRQQFIDLVECDDRAEREAMRTRWRNEVANRG